MSLEHPVKVYVGATNLEAHQVADMLTSAGVEAFAVDDLPGLGSVWAGGLLPQVHAPEVFVEQENADRARLLLDEYNARIIERVQAQRERQGTLEVTCEDCGKTATFPARLHGTVQDCPHCGSYLDVDDHQDVFLPDDVEEKGDEI